ncbi:MAG: hypothetical protein ACPF9D_08525, partial [Owenweeksia sp.]
MELKVQCPECGWKPDGEPYWSCRSCSYEWDMFSTGARCPRCDFEHQYTECIGWAGGCDETSLHLDWYEGLD